MPQLRYLNPDDDDDWGSSPPPESSPSHSAEPAQDDSTPSTDADKTVHGVSPSLAADDIGSSLSKTPPAEHNRAAYSVSSGSNRATIGQRIEPTSNASSPGPSPPQQLPTVSPSTRKPALYGIPAPPPAKKASLQVIDLESTPEISETNKHEDSRSSTPSSSSRLLNNFTSKVPKVRKEEWSDDSSDDDVQAKRGESEFELYHKPTQKSLEAATCDSVDYVKTSKLLQPAAVHGPADETVPGDRLNGRPGSATELDATMEASHSPPRHSHYSVRSIGHRFPRVRRRDLECYVFLAACVKHAGSQFRPNLEAVAEECGLSSRSAGNKLRKLRRRLYEEGVAFGHPGKAQPYGPHGYDQSPTSAQADGL